MSAKSLKEINDLSCRFWNRERALLGRRMADKPIRETAFATICTEIIKAVPIFYRTSLNQALNDAELAKSRFLSEQARKGGNAKKTDKLQLLIEQIVAQRRPITVRQLENELRARQSIGAIEEIDEMRIWFTNHNGQSKTATLSGLKDRLSRARTKLRSR